MKLHLVAVSAVALLAQGLASAQAPPASKPRADKTTHSVPPAAPAATVVPATGVTVPSDYTIGPDDILSVVFWRDKDMTTDVVVRPDGRITLPLVNDVQAGGLTPEALRARIVEQASKFYEDPSVSVVVKQINSRRVYVTGLVTKPGVYPISTPMTVLQLLSMAGGVTEFADTKNIMVMRMENGQQRAYKFNYREVKKGEKLKQNILLQPGDTVVVP